VTGKRVTQLFHAPFVTSGKVYAGYLVEADEVHPALQSTQQLHDGTGVGRGVVQSGETNVLEGATTLVGEIILAKQPHGLFYGHGLLGGHEL
jgi:hypothetical protein